MRLQWQCVLVCVPILSAAASGPMSSLREEVGACTFVCTAECGSEEQQWDRCAALGSNCEPFEECGSTARSCPEGQAELQCCIP